MILSVFRGAQEPDNFLHIAADAAEQGEAVCCDLTARLFFPTVSCLQYHSTELTVTMSDRMGAAHSEGGETKRLGGNYGTHFAQWECS